MPKTKPGQQFLADPFENDLSGVAPAERTSLYSPMGIRNTGFLVDMTYRNALPFQFDRELVKNGIEAKASYIELTPDWVQVERSGGAVYRFRYADNGDGMEGEELIKFFNLLSSSGKVQSIDLNLGMGAKISLLPWNPYGLVVMSWKNGQGAMIKIVKTPDENYGLERWLVEDDDGEVAYDEIVEPPSEYKPQYIEDHGTVILALGMTGTEDTFAGPSAEMDTKAHTVALNRRFFVLPDAVELRVQEFVSPNKEKWPEQHQALRAGTGGLNNRRITGERAFLDRYSKASGQVPLTNATCQWWVLQDDDVPAAGGTRRKNQNAIYNVTGHVAALYDNELYDITAPGVAAHGRFATFGIVRERAYRNIVLVIEPAVFVEGKTLDGAYPDPSRSPELLTWCDRPCRVRGGL